MSKVDGASKPVAPGKRDGAVTGPEGSFRSGCRNPSDSKEVTVVSQSEVASGTSAACQRLGPEETVV